MFVFDKLFGVCDMEFACTAWRRGEKRERGRNPDSGAARAAPWYLSERQSGTLGSHCHHPDEIRISHRMDAYHFILCFLNTDSFLSTSWL